MLGTADICGDTTAAFEWAYPREHMDKFELAFLNIKRTALNRNLILLLLFFHL